MFSLISGLVFSQISFEEENRWEPDFVMVRVTPGMSPPEVEAALDLKPGSLQIEHAPKGKLYASLTKPWWKLFHPEPYKLTFLKDSGLTAVSWRRTRDMDETYVEGSQDLRDFFADSHGSISGTKTYVVGARSNPSWGPRAWRSVGY
ncbi:MAG: hypothetical protein QOJ65_498 [Fimbriimonadaceae bacterium]|jgi:hypothetical protein|nr:hypothetical protein [Fimbriimonadaceae bacterium]